jgi:hypothetical protein
MMAVQEEETIRRLEAELLDKKHLDFVFLRRPTKKIYQHLFKLLGDIHRDIISNIEVGDNPYHKRDYGLRVTRALSHCLRWASEKTNRKFRLPSANWEQLDSEALELLEWAIQYDKLCTEHVAWSRGLSVAKVEEETKTVNFKSPTDLDFTFLFSQAMAEAEIPNDLFSEEIHKKIRKGFSAWLQRYTFRQKGRNLPWKLESHTDEFKLVLNQLEKVLWPYLDSNLNLGGYSLQSFRKLYSALYVHSYYVASSEEYIDATHGPINMAGSLVIVLSERELTTWLAAISGVEQSEVTAIIKDMTFDVNDKDSDIWCQPFFKDSSKTYYSLVRSFSYISPETMLSYNLNRRSKQRIYDQVIQKLEKTSLNFVQEVVEKEFIVFREKRICLTGENTITPDLIAYDDHTSSLLVLEFKHASRAFNTAQVVSRIKNIEQGVQGVKQVEKYLGIIRRNLQEISNILDIDHPQEVYGMLLFKWPMPIPMKKNPDVIKTDFMSLEKYISSSKQVDIQSMVEWFQKRPDVLSYGKQVSIVPFNDITVAEWTYKTEFAAIENLNK